MGAGAAILNCKSMAAAWRLNSWRRKSNLWDEQLDQKKSGEPADKEELAISYQRDSLYREKEQTKIPMLVSRRER